MTYWLGLVFLPFFFVSLFLLIFYGVIAHYHHILARLRPTEAPPPPLQEVPFVTVQLAICNEGDLVNQTIQSLMELSYPKDRWEAQLCDDSTDPHTSAICARAAKHYQRLGFSIFHLQRSQREGFKAGNLNAATPHAKGEIFVILDADFILQSNFLEKNIPFFEQDPKLGAIQTYWTHRNKDASPLTKAQESSYDYHLRIEQQGRSRWGRWMHLNGSACLVRRQALEEVGGWKTYIEDVYLSYQIQLNDWRIRFSDTSTAQALLPTTIESIRSQQKRWHRGSGLAARDLLGKIALSKASFLNKLEAFGHLLGTSAYIGITGLLLFSWPVMTWLHANPRWNWIQWLSPLCFYFLSSGTGSATAFAQRHNHRSFLENQHHMLWLSLYQSGLAPLATYNVLLGLMGYPLRTWTPSNIRPQSKGISYERAFEWLLLCCGIMAIYRGIQWGMLGFLLPLVPIFGGLVWFMAYPYLHQRAKSVGLIA
ncbi:MAG: glycosyltransferase [Myxococcales bacterium]|nr:glycosyltransferase [Myxococcales bacterium]MCB9644933.1 glycosyltransferase [Myxococcales bacterium]